MRLETGSRLVHDITGVVHDFCAGRGDGPAHVFLPHATAGLALMEPAPAVKPTWRRWQSVVVVDTNGDNSMRTLRLSFVSG